MSQRRRSWKKYDAATIARLLKQGRGSGEGATYQPWLRVQDVPSRGLSSRVRGWKTKMLLRTTHHCGNVRARDQVRPYASHGVSLIHHGRQSGCTGCLCSATAQDHQQRTQNEQRQYQDRR
jgi:hypothetical protein